MGQGNSIRKAKIMGNCLPAKGQSILENNTMPKSQASPASKAPQSLQAKPNPVKEFLQQQLQPSIIQKNAKEHAQRLQNIFAAPLEKLADFIAPVHKKSQSEKDFIGKVLTGNFIFGHCKDAELSTIVDAFEFASVEDGTTIIEEGDAVGDYFYIVCKGDVHVYKHDKEVGAVHSGGSFGELSLLYNCPRAATCKAVGKCDLWRLDQQTFRKILASNQTKADNEIKDVLRQVTFMADLNDGYLSRIADAMVEQEFKKDDVIVKKGDVGETFYIIKSGKVSVNDIGMGSSRYVDQEMGCGDSFGERALITGDARAANCIAQSASVTVLMMTRDKFTKVMGPIEPLIAKSQKMQSLSGVPIFARARISRRDIGRIAEIMDETHYSKGQVIQSSTGTNPDGKPPVKAMYLIRSGKVQITPTNGPSVIVRKGDYFNDQMIIKESGVVKFWHIVAVQDTVLDILSTRALRSLFRNVSYVLGDQFKHMDDPLDVNLTLKTLKKHRILGAGTFGKVWLVSNPDTGEPYALKIQSKRVILGYNQVQGVIREKDVMQNINSPFVIKLANAYQDELYLYMVLTLYHGGELFSIIHHDNGDGVDENKAMFYSAVILEGLDYMHRRQIIYRDLKPENVLLDADGYCVIVDLGFAKVVPDKTYTLCGTPLYLAPEVILQRGHNKGADIWSLGVLTFELIAGCTTFYSRGIDQVSLFKKICRGQFTYPQGMFSPDLQNLLDQMIVPRLSERLGCLARGADDLRTHPWYSKIDFDELSCKSLDAPWKPELKDALDTSNFDDWRHLEKEDKKNTIPLSPDEQQKFEKF